MLKKDTVQVPKEEIRPQAFRLETLEDRLAPSGGCGGCGCGCDPLDASVKVSVEACGIDASVWASV